jgi:hypothetical protein
MSVPEEHDRSRALATPLPREQEPLIPAPTLWEEVRGSALLFGLAVLTTGLVVAVGQLTAHLLS